MCKQRILRFVQLLPEGPADGMFSLKDLPGSGKRIDILCRDLAACFDWGPVTWPRQQIQLIAILRDSIVLRFLCPQTLPIGETGWASIVSCSLRGSPPDHVISERKNTRQVIEELLKTDTVTVLDERGGALIEPHATVCSQNSFIIGDQRGLSGPLDELLTEYALPRVSLGPKSYLSSHCIGIIISRFERMMNEWEKVDRDREQEQSQDLSRR